MPSAAPRALDVLLGAVPRDRFTDEHFGRTCAWLAGAPDRFDDLLNWQGLNYVLDTQAFSESTVRIKKSAADIPPQKFLKKLARDTRQMSSRLISRVVNRELRDGATLIVNEIHNCWPPLSRFVEDLERDLACRASANLYVSLGVEHGFDVHYDSHDVFILQVEGRKRWSIYDRHRVLPYAHEHMRPDDPRPAGPPLIERILERGEACYLPRGYWHFVEPIGEPTAHLTIAAIRPNGRDLLEWSLNRLSEDAALRRDLPDPRDPAAAATFIRDWRASIDALLAREDLLSQFLHERRVRDSNTPRPQFGLPWSATDAALPPAEDAQVAVIAGASIGAYRRMPSGEIALESDAPPGPLLPAAAAPLCDFLPTVGTIGVNELRDRFTSVSRDDFVLTLRELARHGLIVVKASRDRQ
jgi:hypothetical protein